MNQYIITEDDLVVWEDDLDAIDGEWGVGRGRGTDEHTNKQVSIINRVRSHPYQSERDKVLDEVLSKARIIRKSFICPHLREDCPPKSVCELCMLEAIIKELRQAGEP